MTQTKKKVGRPAFEPTDEQRRTVRAMVAYGVPQEQICKVIGVTDKTLNKHFKHEIETAAIEANSKVAQSLFRKATSDELVGPSVTAAIFWLKTKAGWKETDRTEHTGPDGGPLKTETRIDASNYPDEELEVLMRVKQREGR